MGIAEGSQTKRLRKSVGDITYYTKNNQTICRKKVEHHSGEMTDPQLKNCCIQKEAGELCKSFKVIHKLGFPQPPKHLSGANVFVQKNRKAITAVKDETTGKYESTVDYTKLICADGELFPAQVSASADAEKHSITFTVSAYINGGRSYPDDMVYAVIYDKPMRICMLAELGDRSTPLEKEVVLPVFMDLNEAEVYTFAVNRKYKIASSSIYVTVT